MRCWEALEQLPFLLRKPEAGSREPEGGESGNYPVGFPGAAAGGTANRAKSSENPAVTDFDSAFASLSRLLRKHAAGFSIKTDKPGDFCIELPAATPRAKPKFFGAVQAKKSYVSYHLMPVYEDPALLDGISDALRRKMQGKSCFNFTADDPALFKELDALTKKCAAASRRPGTGT